MILIDTEHWPELAHALRAAGIQTPTIGRDAKGTFTARGQRILPMEVPKVSVTLSYSADALSVIISGRKVAEFYDVGVADFPMVAPVIAVLLNPKAPA